MLKCKYNKKGAVSIEKLRVLSLFSGIGAFEKALSKQNIPYELVNFCEIDKYAIKSYCAIHNVDKNLNLNIIFTFYMYYCFFSTVTIVSLCHPP